MYFPNPDMPFSIPSSQLLPILQGIGVASSSSCLVAASTSTLKRPKLPFETLDFIGRANFAYTGAVGLSPLLKPIKEKRLPLPSSVPDELEAFGPASISCVTG